MTIPAVEVVVDRISSQEKVISFSCKVATKERISEALDAGRCSTAEEPVMQGTIELRSANRGRP